MRLPIQATMIPNGICCEHAPNAKSQNCKIKGFACLRIMRFVCEIKLNAAVFNVLQAVFSPDAIAGGFAVAWQRLGSGLGGRELISVDATWEIGFRTYV